MDDKELWRQRLQRIQEAMPVLPGLAAYIKRSQDAAPKWPRWIEYLGVVVLLVFVAFGLGAFGDRSYVVFGVFWLFFAVCFLNIRKAAPQFPEFGIFIAWFFFAVMAVFIGYMALHPGTWHGQERRKPHTMTLNIEFFLFTVGQYNLVSWALNSFGVPLDDFLPAAKK